MSKIYSYEDSQKVIRDAWDLAIKHLEDTLSDQYSYNATSYAWSKFQDYVEQDIEFMMTCPRCGKIDIEGNFSTVVGFDKPICYECYTELNGDDNE